MRYILEVVTHSGAVHVSDPIVANEDEVEEIHMMARMAVEGQADSLWFPKSDNLATSFLSPDRIESITVYVEEEAIDDDQGFID